MNCDCENFNKMPDDMKSKCINECGKTNPSFPPKGVVGIVVPIVVLIIVLIVLMYLQDKKIIHLQMVDSILNFIASIFK